MPIIEDEEAAWDEDGTYWDPYGPIPEYKNWFDEGMVTQPYD